MSSSLIPSPVSLTLMLMKSLFINISFIKAHVIQTEPSLGVNFNALLYKLSRTCCNRYMSVQIKKLLFSKPMNSQQSLIPKKSALSCWISMISAIAFLMSKLLKFFLNLPGSEIQASDNMSCTQKLSILMELCWTTMLLFIKGTNSVNYFKIAFLLNILPSFSFSISWMISCKLMF